MLDKRILKRPQGLREQINHAYRLNELESIQALIEVANMDRESLKKTQDLAFYLMEKVRKSRHKSLGIDSFLTQYSLTSHEGIALMCLAEALLRVPDSATIDSLIKDKLTHTDWKAYLGQSHSFFMNATTWALMLTGKVLTPEKAESELGKAFLKLIKRGGEGVVRKAVDSAIRIMSRQFVKGRTIEEALSRSKSQTAEGYRFSYDMLGEAAITEEDAARYLSAYTEAIEAIGEEAQDEPNVRARPGISIKLSALYPRYQESQSARVMLELPPKLLQLAKLAKAYDIGLTIDAEEADRLELSLDIIEKVFKDPALSSWEGFGLAVQSYQKRAFFVLDWVAELARSEKRRINVRLIKGAYWDTEIKRAQMAGMEEYPVFTRKTFTDVSFQACAKKILTMTDAIYPQFATHNAYTAAMILTLVGNYRDFEFQCLHGMGNDLYEQIVPKSKYNIPCRIYAPVGSHEDLLPYLVRRLLENGANSSFVNRIADDKASISEMIQDPVEKAQALLDQINKNIPLPKDIFLPLRKNSLGFDFTNRLEVARLQEVFNKLDSHWRAEPILFEKKSDSKYSLPVSSPQSYTQSIGQVVQTIPKDIEYAIASAETAFLTWSETTVEMRAEIVLRMAELLEKHRATLMAIVCLEAGKTWSDSIAEVREAIDFCYYYAALAQKVMGEPAELKGYTGEYNELSLHPRGLIVCISPWNFPLAIFLGQVVAALVVGNCVIAKPAEQTPLIAYYAVNLLLEAGIPKGVVQLLPGSGEDVGARLVSDTRIKGIIFTGSTQVANLINQTLSHRGGEMIPLIAETGGQNAMIVDSSALLEQVIMDVLTSAFGSAGQRCSALRVVYVQKEIYKRFIRLLKGAMAVLKVGNPMWLNVDVGPVIDKQALQGLQNHIDRMKADYELIYQCELTEECEEGYFIPPTAFAIPHINVLDHEVFGPILHVISYKRSDLDDVIQQINSTGYGLTFGIHSRINQTIEYIRKRVKVGNCYVNRNMIGAVVGLQPFGGEGLSGTGPKAGGPHYLTRLCIERTLTIDTTAAGGNASLMSSGEA